MTAHAGVAKNTKAPVVPVLRYRDATAAVAWLCKNFGFRELSVYRDDKGQVQHAELGFGNGAIMIGPVADTPFGKFMRQPDESGGTETQVSYLVVDDVDSHHARAAAAGATILMAPETKSYGGRDYACRDPFGHIWSIGTYDLCASST